MSVTTQPGVPQPFLLRRNLDPPNNAPGATSQIYVWTKCVNSYDKFKGTKVCPKDPDQLSWGQGFSPDNSQLVVRSPFGAKHHVVVQ